MDSRTRRFLAQLLVTAALTVPLYGQEVDTRIAVVHLKDLVEGSEDFRLASERWSASMAEQTSSLATRQTELRQLQNQLTTDPAIQGAARAALIDRIELLQNAVEQTTTETQERLNLLRDQLLDPVVEKMRNLAINYAEEHGYDILIDTSAPQIGLTLAIQDIDITEELLEVVKGTSAAEPPATPAVSPEAEAPATPAEPADQ